MPLLPDSLRGLPRRLSLVAVFVLALPAASLGEILWSQNSAKLVRDNGAGESLFNGEIKPRDGASSDILYFKFVVEPISDPVTESKSSYVAGLVFSANGQEHLGVGNAWKSWGYSAFNVEGQGPANDIYGEFNLPSAFPEINPSTSSGMREGFEYVRQGVSRTIVFKVQYLPGEPAQVTVWLDPVLTPGATEAKQSLGIESRFRANATFDEIRLVHRGGGEGWKFSDIVVATNFEDLVQRHFWQHWWFIALISGVVIVSVALIARSFERRRSRSQIERLQREQAISAERERIARDIHDELGAELAQIGLLADIGVGDETTSEENDPPYARIAERARMVVASLDEIVWAVEPRNDNLASVADYLCRIADETFEESSIRCRKEVPTGLPEIPIGAELRHDLTLAVKEAFTNVLKHSQASEVRLRLSWTDPELEICVEDDGAGFDPDVSDQGNGLGNQRTRLERNGGSVELDSEQGRGTRAVFRILLSVHK